MTNVYLIYGDTGCGKSHLLHEVYPDSFVPWDTLSRPMVYYKQHGLHTNVAVFDNFDFINTARVHRLKRFIDSTKVAMVFLLLTGEPVFTKGKSEEEFNTLNPKFIWMNEYTRKTVEHLVRHGSTKEYDDDIEDLKTRGMI